MAIVVLDTNASKNGNFDRAVLERIALHLSPDNPRLLIPEVVVLEWTEHAYANHQSLIASIRAAGTLVDITPPPVMSLSECESKIREAIPDVYLIWTPKDSIWQVAVRSQILQIGTGTTKREIKTGAADHIVLACIDAQVSAASDSVKVILFSNDSDLKKVCHKKHGERVKVVLNEWDLNKEVLLFHDSPQELRRRVEEAAQLAVGKDAFETIEGCDVAIHRVTRHLPGQVTFDEPFIPKVKTVQNAVNKDRRFGFATLRHTGSGRWSQGTLGSELTLFVEEDDPMITIIMPIVFELDANDRVINIERSGRPLVAPGGLGVLLTVDRSWSAANFRDGTTESSLVERSRGGVLPDFDPAHIERFGPPEPQTGTTMTSAHGSLGPDDLQPQ